MSEYTSEDFGSEREIRDKGRTIFADACREFVDVDENAHLVKQRFYEEVDRQLGTGEIVYPSRVRLLADHMWKQENSAASRRFSQVIAQLVSGQMTFTDVVEALHVGLGVGEKRKVTLSDLTKDDILAALESRTKNTDKQIAALARDKDNFAVVAGWIDEYGSVPAAWEAGAIEYTEARTA